MMILIMLAPSQELSETTSEVNIKDGDNFPSPCEKRRVGSGCCFCGELQNKKDTSLTSGCI